MESCLWIVFFMLFPDFNMGLLSDYKICGDPECESPMSRVQAVKNHQGKDCRFLNFRRGDTIFVYHKLTGKREDLWAGSVYFNSCFWQESDFFCMDESGYPLDMSHLDTDEDDNLNFQDEGGNKDLVDATELLEDELKTSAIPKQQGGSPSSSWLRSSMTGWLGFAKVEQSGDSEQEMREDEKETKSEASLTSSVTGWLGIGGEDKPNNDEDSVKGREDTFTSTMTGWLGFGEEKKTVALENEENEETGHEKEPAEKFRSRRMSLDLEGSKLQEEEKEDMGTMGWLGSGLASRLGFGSSADGSKESGIREPERDQMLEQPSGFESLDISQPEVSFSEEVKAETVPYTLPVSAESIDAAENNIDHSNTEDVNNLDIDAGIFNKDDSMHNSSQIDDENVGEHNTRDKQISQNDEVIEQPEISSGPDHSLEKLHSNSMEQLEGSMEESENHDVQIKAPGSLEEEGAEITNQVHKTEESTLMSENSPVNRDIHIEEHFNKVTDPSRQEILGVQSELPEETQVSGDQEESNEQSQLGSSPHQGEVGLQQETQTQTVEVTSKDDELLFSGNTESLHDSVSEEGLNETKPNIYMTKESPQILRDGDVDRFKETVKDQSELTEEETSDSENEVFNGNQMKSTIVSERETEEGLKEEGKVEIDKQEAVEVQEQIEEVKQEEQKMKLEALNKQETEKEEEMGDISEEDMELREERQEETEELEKLVEELPEHGHQIREEELKESEEQNEKEEKADVSGEHSSQEEMELAEERQKEMEAEGEKLETVLLEHEQVNEEENMSGAFRASSSQEGAELAEERQKEMEETEEGEKRVEELPEHGHWIRVEELKELEEENEKEEKVDVFVESSNQEGMELAEERQKEMVELKEGEKWKTVLVEHEQIQVERLNESVEPNETEQEEEEMSEVSGESSGQEEMELTEEREKKMKKLNEEEKQRIQQKLQIMTEMYQENELKLHRMLTVEEKERHQKEEKLNKADKNIAMAMEELNNYRKRAEEMEEELEKTKQSYHTQISAHEKKAHNNWLAVRSAERELGDIRRENALLRQKLTDTQFKLDSLDKDPYALNNLARPLSPYGPSPLGRPSSETRPFLSPPTLMDGLPGRLSPRGKQSIYLHVASSHSTMLPNEVLWSPHPQGMMLPPRFSPGGPLHPAPNPNAPYGPPMALPPSDGPPPPRQQSLPSPPQSQSPENRPSPEDAI
uniref:SH3 domain-containing protein n=1 Tax=Xiphophorus maculatus TaxID=8083 RepID=A0A3B5R3J0_XIPMA